MNPAEKTPSVYERGVAAGKRFARDCRRKMRRAVGPDGREHDLVELAADGWVPADLLDQLEERVPAGVRREYEAGFIAGVRLSQLAGFYGMGEN